MDFGIISSICLYISFNTKVTALNKNLAERWGVAIIILAIEGCLWSLGASKS